MNLGLKKSMTKTWLMPVSIESSLHRSQRPNLYHIVEGQEFQDVEQFDIADDSHASGKGDIDEITMWNPQRLMNGKWACNHKCKDKTA